MKGILETANQGLHSVINKSFVLSSPSNPQEPSTPTLDLRLGSLPSPPDIQVRVGLQFK